MRRGLLSVAAFLAGLAGGAALLERWTPPLKVPEYSEKLAHLAEHRKRYDTLFLGSSRVRRQISPRIFDEATGATRSFNFGLDGMGHPELPYVVDSILQLHPKGLKTVVLELTRYGREFGTVVEEGSLRMLHWHTTHYTWQMWRALAPLPWWERSALRWQHGKIWTRRMGNFGRGSEVLGLLPRETKPVDLGPEKSGYFPVPDKFAPQRLPKYERDLVAMREQRGSPPVRDAVFEEATREMIARLHAAGIRVVVVTMPRISPQPPWVPETADAVWRFDEPEAQATFFDPALRYDAQHLNTLGAQAFSRALAESWRQASGK